MASAAPRGLTALLKRGWNEIPEVVGSSAVALVGIAMCVVGVTQYYRKDGDNRRYKLTYVVMRPDDPRAAKVHKD
jgi:hypothetical protein